jgi:hypothetical protein
MTTQTPPNQEQMSSIIAWAREVAKYPESCPPLEVNGQKLPLIAVYGKPDELTETHAAPADLKPFFIADSRTQGETLSAVPENHQYFQLYFDVPLPEAQKHQKTEQKLAAGNTEPVVADIAIAISPRGIEVSCWNGLDEQITRTQDKNVQNLAEIGAANAEDFETINQAIGSLLQDISHNPSGLLYLTQELLQNSPMFRKTFPELTQNITPNPSVYTQDIIRQQHSGKRGQEIGH